MKMDKYELVLDIIEYPDKYTSEQLQEIMSDPETRKIYILLCKIDSAIEVGAAAGIDVDSEWNSFSKISNSRCRRPFFRFGSRAASISAIIFTSVMAVAAGIAVTIKVLDREAHPAASEVAETPKASLSATADTIKLPTDTVKSVLTPVMFEDVPLETIMEKVTAVYDVKVKFNTPEVASLHLYYRLDPTLSLDEVVSQLNTFQQINIRQNGNILNID